jgi:short-subunit dehydrogenase
MKVSNKRILVTGAGNGIGRQLSLQLLKKNALIIGVDLSEQALNETHSLSKHDQNFHAMALDITDKKAISNLPKQLEISGGPVDGLINCAGIIQPFEKVMSLSDVDIQKVMDVNFFALLHITRVFLPHLLNRPKAHIVNVSSMGGFLPVPGQAVYGASKAAVKLLTEALYAELKNTHVKVSIVFPGAIATDIAKNSGVMMEMDEETSNMASFKSMPVEKAAAQIIRGMESDKFRMLIGSDARMMDMFYRLSPKRAVHLILKQMGALLKG